MEKIRRAGLKLLAMMAMVLLSCAWLAAPAMAAARAPEDLVFTDYGKQYQLADFLTGYNVLSFGNTHLGLHCVGGLLVKGDYSGSQSNSGFADGENLPPSCIAGQYLAPNSVYNSRNHRVDPLYVGSGNTVTTWAGWGVTYYNVNGLGTGNNSTTPVYVSNQFFSFDLAYEVVKDAQKTMQESSRVVEPDEENRITIRIGENVTIRSLQDVAAIHLVGDMTADTNTTINLTQGGEITLPMMFINGKQPAVYEQEETGTSIVWNFPGARSLQLPTQNWIGHVVAPDADVAQTSGNFNGCIICRNLYSGAEGHIYNYHSEETSWRTVYSVVKVWNDGNNADGLRPGHINVQLLANGRPQGRPVRLTETSGWYHVWKDLPAEDKKGREIVYSVREEAVEGYASEFIPESATLINTREYEKTSVSGIKTWLNEWGWSRPYSITVRLFANGREVASQVVSTGFWGGSNAYTFSDLPKNENGKAIVYTVQEDPVPGYTGKVEGFNLINTYGVEPVTISGRKIWDDKDNADGLRPQEIVIQLLADGVVKEERVVTAGNGWTYTFSNLPDRDDAGREIVYTIREKAVPQGYTSTVAGYDVTNCHEPEKTSVSGRKIWNDDNDNDGLRPAEITVILLADMEEVARRTVTAADGWTWEFTDLPKNRAGSVIRYTVQEVAVEGYTAQSAGMDLINTHENETIDLQGVKSWAEDTEADRPAYITIRLYRNGEEIDARRVTAAEGWQWTFTGLAKYTGGVENVYTITEDAVPGYSSAVSGMNVTNTYMPETTEVSGRKTWNDDDDRDGKRPESITIRLHRNGEEIDARRVTAAEGWQWTFTGLAKYTGGVENVYTITEDAVPGYSSAVSGMNVTNTYLPETTEVSGRKTWNDDGNRDGKRPESITIRLLANGVVVDRRVVTAADGWAWQFTGLNTFANGQEIVYTVMEDPVPGYTTMITGYDVINSYLPETTSVEGMKLWFDDDDAFGVRPESITIRLLANGTEVESRVITEADGWQWVFPDLPAKAEGEPIEYTITEDPVAEYESVVVGYNVFNTYDRTTFSITKYWEGEDGGEISLTLYADGVRMNPQPAYTRYGQMYIWENLPMFDEDGEEIVYSATEAYMDGYMTIYENTGYYAGETDRVYDGGVIINRGVKNLFVRKVWTSYSEDDEKPPIQLVLYCNGVPTDVPMPEPDKHGWYKYYNLPATVNGDIARYTVRETSMNGFIAIYTNEDGEEVEEGMDGGIITNMGVPATGDHTPLALWACMLTMAAAGMFLLGRRKYC